MEQYCIVLPKILKQQPVALWQCYSGCTVTLGFWNYNITLHTSLQFTAVTAAGLQFIANCHCHLPRPSDVAHHHFSKGTQAVHVHHERVIVRRFHHIQVLFHIIWVLLFWVLSILRSKYQSEMLLHGAFFIPYVIHVV